jgi:hypothetical protein
MKCIKLIYTSGPNVGRELGRYGKVRRVEDWIAHTLVRQHEAAYISKHEYRERRKKK